MNAARLHDGVSVALPGDGSDGQAKAGQPPFDGLLVTERPTVYYDGGCPVCSREIDFYRRRKGGDAFAWVDVTQTDEPALGPGLSRAAALARIHVRRPDGTVVAGAAAFAEIWRGMPGLRWLGRLLGVPPFNALAAFGYRIFLRTRTLWR